MDRRKILNVPVYALLGGKFRDKILICHNMCSPVGTIASGHACAAIRSFVALESDSVKLKHWPDIINRNGPIYKDGYLELPNRPGLGIELNEQVCRKHLSAGAGFFE